MPNSRSVSDALARLKEARRGGVSCRLRQLENDEAPVEYETLDDDAYRARCQQMRREAEAFLEDDEEVGYLDDSPRRPVRRPNKRPPTEEKLAPKKRPTTEKANAAQRTSLEIAAETTPSENENLDAQLGEMDLREGSAKSALAEGRQPSLPELVVKQQMEALSVADAAKRQSVTSTQEPRCAPPRPVENGDVLPFFFLDADEFHEAQGTVYLFGKVAKEGRPDCASCCVRLSCPERVVYFVPRDGIFELKDYRLQYLEKKAEGDPEHRPALTAYLEQVAEPLRKEVHALLAAKQLQGRIRMKIVRRSYAFDTPAIPHGPQYVLKVMFSAKSGNVPLNLQGRTFQAVMGARQSLLESLLLRRRVMGPSWIALQNPTYIPAGQRRSWCEVEIEVTSHKDVVASHIELRNRPGPLLTVTSLQLKSLHNPATNGHEIVMATLVSLKNVPWYDLSRLVWQLELRSVGLEASKGEHLSLHDSEQSLLKELMQRLLDLDPDVLVGHEITTADLSILLHRMQHEKVGAWSQLGRLRRAKFPSLNGKTGILSAIVGRLMCDTFISAHEYLREVDFSLTTLAKSQLGEQRQEMTGPDIEGSYDEADRLRSCLQHSKADAILVLKLMFHLSVLPLTKQLSNLSGSVWNRTLQGQKAQRTDMLLLHEFHNRKFLLPEKKPIGRERDWEGHDNKRSGPQYSGGLVLDPKKGLYDSMVLLLDFNSLYPSIVQEFKLCFTTVDRSGTSCSLPGATAPTDAPLPTVIKGLIDSRRRVKKFIASEKDPLILTQRKIREQALKLTANSMYGCLGFAQSRFYCKPLAELITSQGRAILQKTVDQVEKELGMDVVYGDTDSIMINTGSQDYSTVCHVTAERIKRSINKDYTSLRIDVDGVFQPLLLLKKKKYAAVKLVMQHGQLRRAREDKGLDIVRRDWSQLAKKAGNCVLDEILSGKPPAEVAEAIHHHLKEVRKRVESGRVELGEFEIVKELAKRPEEYTDAKAQPHVLVALRRKQQGHRDCLNPGQAVPYIVCSKCKESTGGVLSQAEKAYHPDEVKERPSELRPDMNFYLANQVHAVVSRLCEPIVEISPKSLAESLGLDGGKYHSRAVSEPVAAPSRAVPDRFRDCRPLLLQWCGRTFPFCGVEAIVSGKTSADDAFVPPGAVEDSAKPPPSPDQVANAACLQARELFKAYFDGECVADEEEESATRAAVYAVAEEAEKWSRRISDVQVYRQLKYWLWQCDGVEAVKRAAKGRDTEKALAKWASLCEHLRPAVEILKECAADCDCGTISWDDLLRPL